MLVPMELSRIIISDLNDQQVVWLRETGGQRSFAIVIGIFEAASINRHVKGDESPHPLTHDLLCQVIDELGGVLEDVVITSLQDHTYYAELRIRQGGKLLRVDSRPSDAIALAVHSRPPLPIYVDESVLDQVAV